MKLKLIYTIILAIIFSSCQSNKEAKDSSHLPDSQEVVSDNKILAEDSHPSEKMIDLSSSGLHDSTFIFLKDWSSAFVYDMKYATTDNFIKQKVYDCDQCMIRKAVAVALIKANEEFQAIGYRIKFFDCYRPLDVQKIMWEVYPVEGYVANPYTSGSIHNRGGAVDITLVDESGKALDMGTEFDFFGKEAHHTYLDLPGKILENRQVLKSIMEKYGFKSIKTEWWHYNFGQAKKYALSNFPTSCD